MFLYLSRPLSVWDTVSFTFKACFVRGNWILSFSLFLFRLSPLEKLFFLVPQIINKINCLLNNYHVKIIIRSINKIRSVRSKIIQNARYFLEDIFPVYMVPCNGSPISEKIQFEICFRLVENFTQISWKFLKTYFIGLESWTKTNIQSFTWRWDLHYPKDELERIITKSCNEGNYMCIGLEIDS